MGKKKKNCRSSQANQGQNFHVKDSPQKMNSNCRLLYGTSQSITKPYFKSEHGQGDAVLSNETDVLTGINIDQHLYLHNDTTLAHTSSSSVVDNLKIDPDNREISEICQQLSSSCSLGLCSFSSVIRAFQKYYDLDNLLKRSMLTSMKRKFKRSTNPPEKHMQYWKIPSTLKRQSRISSSSRKKALQSLIYTRQRRFSTKNKRGQLILQPV